MITPLQQTPIPLDPIRQQITPTTVPIEPPPPPPPTQMPVQASDATQDKFDPQSGDDRNRRGQGLDDRQKAEYASKLRTAYLRLKDLKREADAAAASGDAALARDLAAEAANVASTIPATVGIIEESSRWEPVQSSPSTATTAGTAAATADPTPVEMDVSSALGIARDGLGSAKDTVDIAAGVPRQPVVDRLAINEMRQQVLTAMASVETIATRASDTTAQATVGTNAHVDVRA
jgi:hypothetical protein